MVPSSTAFDDVLEMPTAAATAHVRDILRSHSEPPSHIMSMISTLSDRLTRIDAEIGKTPADSAAAVNRLNSHRSALQAYYDDCRGLLAPIRQLPGEILVEVFTLNLNSWTVDQSDEEESVQNEMALLANKPILTVAQVCLRWRSIAMNTPALWTRLDLGSILWSTPTAINKVMELLRTALERSNNSPLSLLIWDQIHQAALELLVVHSERWQEVTFFLPSSELHRLSGVRGRLPMLEFLEVGTDDEECPVSLDIFDDAPKLTSFSVDGPLLGKITTPPPSQLRTFACLADRWSQVAVSMSSMSALPQGATYSLQLDISAWHDAPNHILALNIPQTMSDISTFSLELYYNSSSPTMAQASAQIFASLTLPHLRDLGFKDCREDRLSIIADRLPWPHAEFLSLSIRSSFHTHLETLRLLCVIITEAELVECLGALPYLRRLEIADHEPGNGRLLLTDNLFRQLTKTPESPGLVPQLRSLNCVSALRFSDSVYLAFLVSRMEEERRFTSEIWWLPDRYRELDADVVAQIDELCVQKRLTFIFEAE
ncbi:hypothetical protein C8R43DRAFT_506415 [Mycena crocata]|nr:hypothetical protein C8R43DRAFT_506415 [Mycena crocata]